MSNRAKSFMDLALRGEVLPDEIDDFVDRWHDSHSEGELAAFLGMTADEYSFWVSNPEYISLVIAARHRHQSIMEAVNDNAEALDRLAARSDQPQKIALLRRWIEQQGGV